MDYKKCLKFIRKNRDGFDCVAKEIVDELFPMDVLRYMFTKVVEEKVIIVI